MSAEQQPASPLPEVTSFTRVANVPIVAYGWQALRDAVARVPGSGPIIEKAQNLTTVAAATASKYAEPYSDKIATVVGTADGLANIGLNIAENKFPFVFQAPAEEVIEYGKEVTEKAKTAVLDGTLKARAIDTALVLDTQAKPLVDYIESRLPVSEAGPSSADSQYQYQRALGLSRSATIYAFTFSTEQLLALKQQNELLSRATETAQSLTSVAAASAAGAQARVKDLIGDFDKIKESSAALTESVKARAQNLPAPPAAVTTAYAELVEKLGPAIAQLRAIVAEEGPWSEKAVRIGHEVSERVAPGLELVKAQANELLTRVKVGATPEEKTA